jgi:hypothetical protein
MKYVGVMDIWGDGAYTELNVDYTGFGFIKFDILRIQ